MVNAAQLTEMSADELRVFASSLLGEISDVRRDNVYKQTKIDQLTHEMALLKRHRFGKAAEHMKGDQRQLFDETVAADLEALTQELKALQSPTAVTTASHSRASRSRTAGSAIVSADSPAAFGNLHAYRDEIVAPMRALVMPPWRSTHDRANWAMV